MGAHRVSRGRASRSLRAAALLVLAGAVAGACTSPHNGSAATRSRGHPSPVRTGARTAASSRDLAWRGCYGDFRCARLRVPVDYSNPKGPSLRLAVIQHPAPGAVGPLFTDPGGPGGSGVDAVRANAGFWPRLAKRFDVVGFDPRGSNRSDPIRCLGPRAMDHLFTLDPVPGGAALHRFVAGTRAYVRACRRRSGPVLRFMDTVTQARDMDRLRAAMDASRISYLGFSYGTDLGAVYAGRFGGHVRAMVLDGDSPPDVGAWGFVAGQAGGFERNLGLFLSWCRTDPSCPYRPHAGSSRAVVALLHRLDHRAMPAGSRRLTAAEAYYAVGTGLYGPRGWPFLAAALAAAQRGDGSLLLQAFDRYMGRNPSGGYSTAFDAYNATMCEDKRWPRSPAVYVRWARRLGARFPVFGAWSAYSAMPCAYWPRVGRVGGSLRGVRVPVLLVGATQDPATPYAWTRRLHRELAGSVVLTRRGPGHTSYFASPCVRDAVDAFLVSLTRPRPGLSCATPR